MNEAQKAVFYAAREAADAASRDPALDIDLSEAMARAEADGAAHAAWMATDPTPLEMEMELAHLGLAGLAERYGFDHSGFSARFLRADDLADLEIPGMGPVPTVSPAAGTLGAIVVKPAAPGQPWRPMSGLTLTWHGDGAEGEREKFSLLLGSWFSGLFAALRSRLDTQRVKTSA